ncbi:MAG: phosphoribosylformylglycinamidine cyclo-ligase [Acidaminococcales bacterium]|jgi:phosphoribosylformylglycinamidine cyclo-ligase|nr:phosphoribosylformylglycinamidine cyclo-ligase [Acidaminococcales bacterium]
MKDDQTLTYRAAGVDIDAGNRAVELIRHAVKSTYRPEVIGDIGGFGGLFALSADKYKNPVLVSSTDGVGTKLKIAFMLDKHGTIGQDAVAMCVNDILAQGAEPLFFLDYLATGRLVPEKVAEIVGGVAAACKESGCALIGGESAEMAGFYREGEYDIAGFAVGIAEKASLITGRGIKAGDVIIGLPSSGLHSNGFSLVRKICFEINKMDINAFVPAFGKTLGEELIAPTRLYPPLCLPLIEKFLVKGMVHVTGGGFVDNIPRILPENCAAEIDADSWAVPPVFAQLKEWGNVPWPEMYRTFNMGMGMLAVVSERTAKPALEYLAGRGEKAKRIGRIVEGGRKTILKGGAFDG